MGIHKVHKTKWNSEGTQQLFYGSSVNDIETVLMINIVDTEYGKDQDSQYHMRNIKYPNSQ